MTCKDCIHYKACMHTRTAILDPYQACLSDKDTEECSDWFTTDVQEVKHAKWIGKPLLGYSYCRCSNCHKITEVFVSRYGVVTQKYCPNCGAKMDLEDK